MLLLDRTLPGPRRDFGPELTLVPPQGLHYTLPSRHRSDDFGAVAI